MARQLTVRIERFPVAGRFTIARGSRTEITCVTATVTDGGIVGRGECVPYARYGETVDGVVAAIEAQGVAIADGLDRIGLQGRMGAGAARNAVDCALWDLDAKRAGVPAATLAGIDRLSPVTTAYTISLDEPAAMAEAVRRAADRPVLKIKLGAPGGGDLERIAAVRSAAPDATLIVDANEGWRPAVLDDHLRACADAGVALVEQPLPAADDLALAAIRRPVPICADESVHAREGLADLVGRYDAVNIKLDKTGGLTEALLVAGDAERLGFGIMVGCMLGTSLAMAPAFLLAGRARFVDLDGPLLLAADRPEAMRYDGSLAYPPEPALWG